MLQYYWGVLRGERQPVRFVISRVLRHSGLCERIVIQKRGFRLRFYPSNQSAIQWMDPYHLHDKEHGHEEETFFGRFLQPGDVVVDVGANIGLTALAAFSAVGPSGHVHAFEPHPRIFDFLVGNIELNGAETAVTPYNLALGDHAGTTFFSNHRADDQNAVSDGITDVCVPICTLDDVLPTVPSIALLKIDVEGYEKFVLLGATQTLARVDCVYFEALRHKLATQGHTLDDVIGLLAAHDFEVRQLADGCATTVPFVAGARSSGPWNLVAARDFDHLHRRLERLPSVGDRGSARHVVSRGWGDKGSSAGDAIVSRFEARHDRIGRVVIGSAPRVRSQRLA